MTEFEIIDRVIFLQRQAVKLLVDEIAILRKKILELEKQVKQRSQE